MTVTLDDIAALVNMEVGNTSDHGTASHTGAANVTRYLIAPPFRSVVDDADFAFYVGGVLDQTGTMDFDNGVYTDSVARPATALTWDFNYQYWSNAQVFAAVNAGIGILFPSFYRTIREDITSDGTSTEYVPTTANIEELRSIQTSTDGVTFTSSKRTGAELDYNGTSTILKFYTAPVAGTIRASFICRPTQLATNESLLDIPDRAVAPIVSYACYHLLNQKQAPRLRADIALATVGGGNLSPRQMNDASNSFMLRHQMQLAQVKMRPWRVK